jgi:hypothetical protein
MAIVDPSLFLPARPADYAWDEPRYLAHFHYLPGDLHDRLLRLTHNANLALAIGCGYWILARLAPLDPDREPMEFTQAVWAEMTQDYACDRHYPPSDLWRGPVRGAMVTEMTILFDALDERGNNPVIADRAVWMHNFARHVIGPMPVFDAWLEATVQRLELHHSWTVEGNPQAALFDDHFPVGYPVPPEALDPAYLYDPTLANFLLERHINRLLRDGNRFVLDAGDHDH